MLQEPPPSTLRWQFYRVINKPAIPFSPYPAVGSLPKLSSINFVAETSGGTEDNPPSRPKSMESQQQGSAQVVTDYNDLLNSTLQSNQDPDPPPLMIGEGLPQVPGKLANRIQSGHLQNYHKHSRMGAMFWDLTAIVSKSQPKRAADLIIQVSQSSYDDDWLGYDCTFRLKAAARKNLKWVDTLWHISFSAQGNSSICRRKHCLSLHHTSAECSWDFGNHTIPTQHLQPDN